MEILDQDIKSIILEFEQSYLETKKPVRVNFRDLVPFINRTERFSHLIHPYPAKLLTHIPYFFLNTDYFCPDGGIVLDPFCGTGTVLLEAKLAGKKSYGADANPLARLISSVKTKYISQRGLKRTLKDILQNAQAINAQDVILIDEVSYWFDKKIIFELSKLKVSIENLQSEDKRNFFKVCFSSLVKKISYADPRISVPVKLNPHKFKNNKKMFEEISMRLEWLSKMNVFDRFSELCLININRIGLLKEYDGINIFSKIISKDARNITRDIGTNIKLPSQSVDLVLTSPPYAGAQKYIRASSLNLKCLGIADNEQLRVLNSSNIGREKYKKCELNQSLTGISEADALLNELYAQGKYERGHIVANYILEMQAAIAESVRVLKNGGFMIIVIGNNTVCGLEFETQKYLSDYICSLGLNLQFSLIDDIKSYGLMTKRNKTASKISSEYVLVFKK